MILWLSRRALSCTSAIESNRIGLLFLFNSSEIFGKEELYQVKKISTISCSLQNCRWVLYLEHKTMNEWVERVSVHQSVWPRIFGNLMTLTHCFCIFDWLFALIVPFLNYEEAFSNSLFLFGSAFHSYFRFQSVNSKHFECHAKSLPLENAQN